MQNPVFEIAIESPDPQPYHSFKLGELNRFKFKFINNSNEKLILESVHGTPSLLGSTEVNRSTTIFLCFGTLFSKKEIENIVRSISWTSWIETKEVNGEVFLYIVLTLKEEMVVSAGSTFGFTVEIHPTGSPQFSYLSIEFDNLKKEIGDRRIALSQYTTKALFLSRTVSTQKKFQLSSGIIGDDIVYISPNNSITNKFTVYLINPGDALDFDSTKHPKLRLKFGKGFNSSSISLADGRWDSTSNAGEFDLLGTWTEGEVKELKFTCTMHSGSNNVVTSLQIETLNIPGFNDTIIYVPIKVQEQNQIGSEALSILISNETILIK